MFGLDSVIFSFFYRQFKILGSVIGYGAKEGAILYLLILIALINLFLDSKRRKA